MFYNLYIAVKYNICSFGIKGNITVVSPDRIFVSQVTCITITASSGHCNAASITDELQVIVIAFYALSTLPSTSCSGRCNINSVCRVYSDSSIVKRHTLSKILCFTFIGSCYNCQFTSNINKHGTAIYCKCCCRRGSCRSISLVIKRRL